MDKHCYSALNTILNIVNDNTLLEEFPSYRSEYKKELTVLEPIKELIKGRNILPHDFNIVLRYALSLNDKRIKLANDEIRWLICDKQCLYLILCLYRDRYFNGGTAIENPAFIEYFKLSKDNEDIYRHTLEELHRDCDYNISLESTYGLDQVRF